MVIEAVSVASLLPTRAEPVPNLPLLVMADVMQLTPLAERRLEMRQQPPNTKRMQPTRPARRDMMVAPIDMPQAAQITPDAGGVATGQAVVLRDLASAYARLLWQSIMVQRPAGVRLRGTVVVRFTVDANGQLLTAVVVQSSASDVLDGIALETVHLAAPFPAPPNGLSDDQRSFAIPFEFK